MTLRKIQAIYRGMCQILYSKLISMNASARENGDDSFANKYLRVIVLRALGQSSGGNSRAVPPNSGPVTFPRIVQGATFTCGLLRMRLVLPMLLRVMT